VVAEQVVQVNQLQDMLLVAHLVQAAAEKEKVLQVALDQVLMEQPILVAEAEDPIYKQEEQADQVLLLLKSLQVNL
jgi:hypothetical protein